MCGKEFLALCHWCRENGHYIPSVDVVGPGGWRVARVLPKAGKQGAGSKGQGVKAVQLGLAF